jgi:hypothetical protein
MLNFLWHLRGSVALDGVGSHSIALDRLERLLARQQKSISERGSDYLLFNSPLWRNNPFGPKVAMLIYDRGRFWVEQGLRGRRLRYDLRSLHFMVLCLFAASIPLVFGLAYDRLSEGLKFAAAGIAWLYGMNILLALVRVPSGIRKAVTSD